MWTPLFLQYFKNSLNTRLSIVYIETWKELNKVAGFGKLPNINQALSDFSEYVGTRLYQVSFLCHSLFLNEMCSYMIKTMCARLRDLSPMTGGGITQPKTNPFDQRCK